MGNFFWNWNLQWTKLKSPCFPLHPFQVCNLGWWLTFSFYINCGISLTTPRENHMSKRRVNLPTRRVCWRLRWVEHSQTIQICDSWCLNIFSFKATKSRMAQEAIPSGWLQDSSHIVCFISRIFPSSYNPLNITTVFWDSWERFLLLGQLQPSGSVYL